jgi:ATP-dependent Clp protease ATP-binding subunit ClpA
VHEAEGDTGTEVMRRLKVEQVPRLLAQLAREGFKEEASKASSAAAAAAAAASLKEGAPGAGAGAGAGAGVAGAPVAAAGTAAAELEALARKLLPPAAPSLLQSSRRLQAQHQHLGPDGAPSSSSPPPPPVGSGQPADRHNSHNSGGETPTLTAEHIAEVVSRATGTPATQMTCQSGGGGGGGGKSNEHERELYRNLPQLLQARVAGQPRATAAAAACLQVLVYRPPSCSICATQCHCSAPATCATAVLRPPLQLQRAGPRL